MAMFSFNQMRVLWGLLIVLAFLAQSVIPAGYMPSFKTGHAFEIVICHGADEVTLLVDENMQPIKSDTDHQQSDNSKSCVYTASSAKHLAFQTFISQQIEHLIYEEFVETAVIQNFKSIATRSYFGQGPPTFLS